MKILGIDPGSSLIGYAIIKKGKNNTLTVLDFGCISTEKTTSPTEKIKKIYKETVNLIKKYNPHLIAVEKIFFFKNLKTALPVSEARGVILLAAAHCHKKILEYTPLQVKITITGYGRAQKKQLEKVIKKMVDLKKFNPQEKQRKKDDAFDALGVALCAYFSKSSIVKNSS